MFMVWLEESGLLFVLDFNGISASSSESLSVKSITVAFFFGSSFGGGWITSAMKNSQSNRPSISDLVSATDHILHYHEILYELFTTSYHARESSMKIRSLVTLYLWAYMYFYPSFPYFLTNLGGLWYRQSNCHVVKQLCVSLKSVQT